MSTCFCTGACIRGGACIAYPYGKQAVDGRLGDSYNYSTKLEIDSIRQQVNAQKNTINHTQKGIEKCFEWLEKLDEPRVLPGNKIPSPFEYIAVDAKRRDDMTHIKKTLYEFYCWIINTIEDNKERSKGIERLEEAAMWLNKSISRRKGNGT